jgi:HSP20 family protein
MEQRSNLPALFTRPSWALGRFSDWPSEFERFFDDFARRRLPASFNGVEAFNPSIDVAETSDAIDVTVELPGCESKDVDVSVTGQTVTIRGEKKSDKESKGKNWQMSERSYGSFSRAIPLDFSVDAGKIEATFDKGVLKVHVPKPPEAKSETKKIAIKS